LHTGAAKETTRESDGQKATIAWTYSELITVERSSRWLWTLQMKRTKYEGRTESGLTMLKIVAELAYKS